jgi:hypothetical protein
MCFNSNHRPAREPLFPLALALTMLISETLAAQGLPDSILAALNNRAAPSSQKVFADSHVAIVPSSRASSALKESLPQLLQPYQRGFPDLQIVPRRILESSRIVVIEGVLKGTHRAPFRGHTTTSRPVGTNMLYIGHLQKDVVADSTIVLNDGFLLSQLQPVANRAAPVPVTPTVPERLSANPVTIGKELIAHIYRAASVGVLARIAFLAGDGTAVLSLLDEFDVRSIRPEVETLLRSHAGALSRTAISEQEIFSVGGYVIARMMFKARHIRRLGPIAPTNRDFSWPFYVVGKVYQGRLAATQIYADTNVIASQLRP